LSDGTCSICNFAVRFIHRFQEACQVERLSARQSESCHISLPALQRRITRERQTERDRDRQTEREREKSASALRDVIQLPTLRADPRMIVYGEHMSHSHERAHASTEHVQSHAHTTHIYTQCMRQRCAFDLLLDVVQSI
jgi:hypothetical protein